LILADSLNEQVNTELNNNIIFEENNFVSTALNIINDRHLTTRVTWVRIEEVETVSECPAGILGILFIDRHCFRNPFLSSSQLFPAEMMCSSFLSIQEENSNSQQTLLSIVFSSST
jgi:hypothetical protein